MPPKMATTSKRQKTQHETNDVRDVHVPLPIVLPPSTSTVDPLIFFGMSYLNSVLDVLTLLAMVSPEQMLREKMEIGAEVGNKIEKAYELGRKQGYVDALSSSTAQTTFDTPSLDMSVEEIEEAFLSLAEEERAHPT